MNRIKSFKKSLRKKWIVHLPFQSNIILFGVSVAVVALGFAYVAILVFFWKCYDVLQAVGIGVGHPVYRFLVEQQNYLGFIFSIAAFCSIVVGAFIGLVISHRVAGPLKRLHDQLLEMSAGCVPRSIEFRKDDYFKELAAAYNAWVASKGEFHRPKVAGSGSKKIRPSAASASEGESMGLRTSISESAEASSESETAKKDSDSKSRLKSVS